MVVSELNVWRFSWQSEKLSRTQTFSTEYVLQFRSDIKLTPFKEIRKVLLSDSEVSPDTTIQPINEWLV